MILHVFRRGYRWAYAPVFVLSIVILLGHSTVNFAAKEKKTAEDWAPITQAERDLKRVEQDPEADAVILYTERSGRIMKRADDTVNVMNFQWRLKVLTDRGKRYGEIHIPAQKYSRVSNIQARTIKPDGSIVALAPDQVFEKLVRQIGNFKWTEWVFNFPVVEQGAILEYRYERHDNNLLFIDPWYFEDREFTLRSVFKQALPGNMSYSVIRSHTGDSPPSITDWREGSMKGKLFTLEMRDLRGYKDEHRCSVNAVDLIEGERGCERATSSVLIVLASNCEKEETPWPDDSLSEYARS